MIPQRPDTVDFLTGRLSHRPRPDGIVLPGMPGKFTTDGHVQVWPGNTFICHVDPASDAHRALREMQEQVKMSPFHRFYTFLPPSSFHMTVFQGMTEATRLNGDLPADLPRDISRDAMTAELLARTRDLALPQTARVRMMDLFAGKSVTMTGADPAEEDALRATRRALRDATGLNERDFDGYVFHITLAYLVDWVTEPTARAITAFSSDLSDQYRDAVGVVDLGAVELCNFESMHHFEPIRRLG